MIDIKTLSKTALIISIGLLAIGCGNLFESFEDLESQDKQEIAEIKKENGDYSEVKETALDTLADLGVDYDVPAPGATQEERDARVDAAEATLAIVGAAPVDLLQDVIDLNDSGSVGGDEFLIAMSDELPPTSSIDDVLLAADNLRENVNTDNANDALLAATAEATAVSMIVTMIFDNDGDGVIGADENQGQSDDDILNQWLVASNNYNLLDHAQGAVEMFGHTTGDGGSNDALDMARDTFDQLDQLTSNWDNGLVGTTQNFVAQLNNILGFN